MNNNEYSLNNSNNRNVYYPSVSATNNTQDEQDEEIIETQEMELAQQMNDLNNNATTTRGLSSSFTQTIITTKKWINIIYNFLNYFTYFISFLAIINCFLYGALILAEFGFNAEGRNTLLEKGIVFFVFLIVGLISLMRGIIGIEVIVQISLFVGPDNFPPSFGLAGYIVYGIYYGIAFCCQLIRLILKFTINKMEEEMNRNTLTFNTTTTTTVLL